jgi:dihydrodipicolinate synthase/N-acetylneuraminate lyase
MQLAGLYTAIITPLNHDGSLALELFPALLEFQRAAGIDGVVVCGTNGEGTSLSVAERMKTLDKVMEHRDGLSVIAATGATSLTDATELTRHAAEHGVDASLLLPPFFFKQAPVDGLAAYFLPVLDEIDLPMLLYNIPQMTAVPITDALLERLGDHPRLAGIKDSAGDWARTHEFITRYPHLKTFAGSEYSAARCLRAGGAGCISGSSNAFPDLLVAVSRAFQSGDAAATDAAQARLEQMLNILVRYPFVGASKSVLAHRGFPRMGVRPTLVNLTPAQEAEMIGEFEASGLL